MNDTSSVTAAASTAEGIYGVPGDFVSSRNGKTYQNSGDHSLTLILALIRMQRAKKRGVQAEGGYSFKKVFPFFILFFIAAALITTVIGVLPESGFTAFYSGSFVTAMKWLAKFFIAMAMCAIGLNTNLIDLVKKGGKPMLPDLPAGL